MTSFDGPIATLSHKSVEEPPTDRGHNKEPFVPAYLARKP